MNIPSSTPLTAQPGKPPALEPDYRFTLANERTFLAWQRTSLGLLAASVAVVQFMPESPIPGMRQMLGAMVGLLAALAAATGLRRWAQVDRAIRQDRPIPRPAAPAYLAWGLVGIVILTVALTLATTAHR